MYSDLPIDLAVELAPGSAWEMRLKVSVTNPHPVVSVHGVRVGVSAAPPDWPRDWSQPFSACSFFDGSVSRIDDNKDNTRLYLTASPPSVPDVWCYCSNPDPEDPSSWDCDPSNGLVSYFFDIGSIEPGGQASQEVTIDFTWTGRQPPSPQLQIVDPNVSGSLSLIQGGAITSNLNELAIGGRPVSGFVADGVTPLVLRVLTSSAGSVTFTISDEAGNTSNVGSLRLPGGSPQGTSLTTSTVATASGRHAAFAVLTAPMDFSRGTTDDSAASRPIRVNALFTPSGGQGITTNQTLTLHRPTVMLLHGLWSNGDSWEWPLRDSSILTVHVQDYRDSAHRSFQENVPQAAVGVWKAVEKMRSRGIAATQADVIAHSMGGLLARMYIGDSTPGIEYRRQANTQNNGHNNFLQGDIHKLITVDTPHKGSALANELVSENGWPKPLGVLWSTFGPSIFGGAVQDLRTDSRRIANMPATPVPSHAIVADGGNGWLNDPQSRSQLWLDSLKWSLQFYAIDLNSLLGPDHDVIVSKDSQLGGLGSNSTCQVTFTAFPHWANHLNMNSESLVSDWAMTLLNKRTTDAAFCNPGFPAGVSVAPAPPLPVGEFTVTPGGVTITSPSTGSQVAPGSQLAISVESVGGFTAESVMIAAAGQSVTATTPPYNLMLTIPETANGTVRLVAYATDGNGNMTESEPVDLTVNVSANLTGLSVDPDPILFWSCLPTQQVRVLGQYSDGVVRDITAPSLGFTYMVADPAVATVDNQGLVTAHSTGSTTLVITNGLWHKQAVIEVRGVSVLNGDLDGDGDTDESDFGLFSSCSTGPSILYNPDQLPLNCRLVPDAAGIIAADLDRDGDVDHSDFGLFQRCYSGNGHPTAPNCTD